jgi:hypothetical protein
MINTIYTPKCELRRCSGRREISCRCLGLAFSWRDAKRKNIFIKYYILGNIHTASRDIQALKAFMERAIAKKGTSLRTKHQLS